ncbi:MAG: cupin domain-containing protein [Pirellulales bacterium]
MRVKTMRSPRACILAAAACGCLLAVAGFAADHAPSGKYSPSGPATRWLDGPSGVTIKMLVEPSNLGGTEVEIGEITFPAGYKKSPAHGHAHVEMFYVLSGKLGHEVDGKLHVIEPGMVGIVRPGDRVVHSVQSDEPVRALVIWAPAGEADALVKSGVFKSRAADASKP